MRYRSENGTLSFAVTLFFCLHDKPKQVTNTVHGQAMAQLHSLISCLTNVLTQQIEIDSDKCISVDYFGRPVDIYSEPDYKMQCIGFWKENLKSYLITYDQFDAYSRYRCWVYQRADLNKILLSMSVGAFCHIRQDVTSSNSREGAQVHLAMVEYERERKLSLE